jgi:hypothetical protein
MRAVADVLTRAGRLVLAAALAFVLALPDPAFATSCSREVAAQIRFPAHQACWTYRGSATSFVGKFASGQRISAEMSGEATDYDPRNGSAAKVLEHDSLRRNRSRSF